MSHANKEYYKKVYSQIHASCELQERLMDMGEQKEIREELLKKQRSRRGRQLAWRVAAAAAVMAVAVPTGAYAANQISHYLFEGKADQKDYQVDISVKKPKVQPAETEKDAGIAAVKDAGPVALKGVEIPGYMLSSDRDQNGWYDFCADGGFESGKEFSVEVIKVDVSADKGIFIQDVESSKDVTVNGQKAVSIHMYSVAGSAYNKETDYTRRLVVFYEEIGYILHFYAQEGLGEDALLQYAGQISLQPCNKKKACNYIALSQYMEYNQDTHYESAQVAVADSQIYQIGQTVEYEGVEYEVQKVEVTDSVQDILKGNRQGIRSNVRYWKKITDKNGKLKTYTREALEEGNGKSKPWRRVTASEEIALKFVRLTVRIRNNTKKVTDNQICQPLVQFQEKDGIRYEYRPEYGMPEAIEECQLENMPEYFEETKGGQHFYFKELQPGEEAVCHIGYFVDEDKLGNMAVYMEYWDNGNGEAYIDISQK